jgi:hypothetical protein
MKRCVPEATSKLNEMDKLGWCNGNYVEDGSVADTEEDRRDSKSKEFGDIQDQNCLFFWQEDQNREMSQGSEQEDVYWFLRLILIALLVVRDVETNPSPRLSKIN